MGASIHYEVNTNEIYKLILRISCNTLQDHYFLLQICDVYMNSKMTLHRHTIGLRHKRSQQERPKVSTQVKNSDLLRTVVNV